jgi:hypothetical protein
LFVCLQGGALRVIKAGTLLSTPFLTVSVDSSGERGLLGVAFDPDFATNQFVYVYYTTPVTPIHNRVSRFTANGDVAVASSEVIILELDNLSTATNHNAGALHFGLDGKLYLAVGENANSANSQTLNNRLGKILRINADGTIPADNPFSTAATGANRAIWALGLRNPFTFAIQPGGGRRIDNFEPYVLIAAPTASAIQALAPQTQPPAALRIRRNREFDRPVDCWRTDSCSEGRFPRSNRQIDFKICAVNDFEQWVGFNSDSEKKVARRTAGSRPDDACERVFGRQRGSPRRRRHAILQASRSSP